MLDLDDVQARCSVMDIAPLVAELRAARQVIEACHAAERYDYDNIGVFRINQALDAYDQFTEETTPS